MFDYIIKKIDKAKIIKKPYDHFYVQNLFSLKHFSQLIKTKEININNKKNNDDLFASLFKNGYKIIGFPGCITSQKKYVKWQENKINNTSTNIHSACEGFGMTLRLYKPESEILIKLKKFISSKKFNSTIAKKFNIKFSETTTDNGIQKYLDGYEISPHPDYRNKAATFMVNINPHKNSENLSHHTHYLKTKNEFNYVTNFWHNNKDIQRSWIPWNWCEADFIQSKNNSIVLFSPSDFTLHGVKAKYNHLKGQRTQLYGNLWYKKVNKLKMIDWETLDFKNKNTKIKNITQLNMLNLIPPSIKNIIKKVTVNRNKKNVIKDRLKKL